MNKEQQTKKMITNYMSKLTPKEIIAELNRFVIGQDEAKKAVAIALRNRWRRRQVEPKALRDDIMPHNILMVGPTGVGKTEIARRLAKLANAPFIKVEATKFTEVGYVGRDVESIIRDLLDIAIKLVRDVMRQSVVSQAIITTENRIIDCLVGNSASEDTRQKFNDKLKKGELDKTEIEITVAETNNPNSGMSTFDIPGMPGGQVGMLNLSDLIGKAFNPKKSKTIRTTVAEAYKIILREESDNLIDEEKVINEAIQITEEEGIVFLDEIDKIASKNDGGHRGEVSREGVQRDLLPLVEGTVVSTKYGSIKTNYILFIASGAFHMAKPSDLLPELQGRLPIRVHLNPLTKDNLMRILTEPEHSMTKQSQAMLEVEKVNVEFTDDGISKIADIAKEMNDEIENIGARRLHTILEKVLEDMSFEASETPGIKIKVTASYVEKKLETLTKTNDLRKFLL